MLATCKTVIGDCWLIINNRDNTEVRIFGRCLDEIFLTWNESEDKLYDILNTIKRQYREIQITITINDNINYLNVNIGHIYGNLKIQVAHDLDTEPYTLPYVFGHQQRHKSRTLARAAFIRATRCYANVSDFANELQDIQLPFQYNRFEYHFFIYKFQLFLEEFTAPELELHKGEAYYDQSLYDYLLQNVYNYNQIQKKAKIKRLRRQTIQYKWKHSFDYLI